MRKPTSLRWTDLLDARPFAESSADPVAGAVNIPLAELANRVHELPAPGSAIRVLAAGGVADLAARLLAELGRPASVASVGGGGGELGATYRLWNPNPWVEQTCEHLDPGAAIDLGCGVGRDSVWLASLGWNVVAVDRLPDALELGRELERRYVEQPCIHWTEDDIEADYGDFDLAILALCFTLDAARGALSRLRPGGRLIVEAFTDIHREATGRPRNAAFVTGLDQLGALGQVIAGDEAWRGERHTVRAMLLRS